METKRPKKILVTPLDWGLGHTTRCIPLIHYISQLGHHPIVAGNESQCSFIRHTFDDKIETIHLDGYNVTYSKWNRFLQMGLLAQLPSISAAIAREHQWLKQKAEELQVDGIISDNRYGLYHSSIPSVIITHQLQILSGLGNIPDRTMRRVHYKYLGHFSEIWIPDVSDEPNLGGKLSHPAALPENTKYIGPLSRFENIGLNKPASKNSSVSEDRTLNASLSSIPPGLKERESKSVLILLSGPEPQRSILSSILWHQADKLKEKIIFIEGSEAAERPATIPSHITWHKLLTEQQLAHLLVEASIVICRSGYSTIMDLVALTKKAILIPTPGQTEQEYLANHLNAKGIFYSTSQRGCDLQKALAAATQFPYHPLRLQTGYTQYQAVLNDWILSL